MVRRKSKWREKLSRKTKIGQVKSNEITVNLTLLCVNTYTNMESMYVGRFSSFRLLNHKQNKSIIQSTAYCNMFYNFLYLCLVLVFSKSLCKFSSLYFFYEHTDSYFLNYFTFLLITYALESAISKWKILNNAVYIL